MQRDQLLPKGRLCYSQVWVDFGNCLVQCCHARRSPKMLDREVWEGFCIEFSMSITILEPTNSAADYRVYLKLTELPSPRVHVGYSAA